MMLPTATIAFEKHKLCILHKNTPKLNVQGVNALITAHIYAFLCSSRVFVLWTKIDKEFSCYFIKFSKYNQKEKGGK